MNKQQKDYLLSEVTREARKKVADFKAAHPTEAGDEEKQAKLKKAGFVNLVDLSKKMYSQYSQLELPVTSQHKANAKKIAELEAATSALLKETQDTVHLGDSKDALAILAEMRSKLARL